MLTVRHARREAERLRIPAHPAPPSRFFFFLFLSFNFCDIFVFFFVFLPPMLAFQIHPEEAADSLRRLLAKNQRELRWHVSKANGLLATWAAQVRSGRRRVVHSWRGNRKGKTLVACCHLGLNEGDCRQVLRPFESGRVVEWMVQGKPRNVLSSVPTPPVRFSPAQRGTVFLRFDLPKKNFRQAIVVFPPLA